MTHIPHPSNHASPLAGRIIKNLATLLSSLALVTHAGRAIAQVAYFADGYHGGVYGHYPPSFTQFIVDALQQHPDWKLNLEIEPETWDFAQTNTPDSYATFHALVADQSSAGRIEFVNPAYGQSYLWNIHGESVIQQFDRGLRKIRQHFPNATFKTYCSEEPCFTSALPGILRSFGFTQAVLKNPNTCWGGYTRGFAAEVVNWVGPDGTGIPTVPRYAIEALKPGSTWETIAAANPPAYVRAAFEAGIAHPVGMCLQDAGWRFGPWLSRVPGAYQPTEYTTWRNYFDRVPTNSSLPDWRFGQEDVQVSLVWGAQVLQRIAQQVRRAENRIVMAEKMATLAAVYGRAPWPTAALDEGWRTLLLSQHHDCWIVPYNGRRGDTWADKVAHWTSTTCRSSESIIDESTRALVPDGSTNGPLFIRVFNTLSFARTNLATVTLPSEWSGSPLVRDDAGREVSCQLLKSTGPPELVFCATVPALGYSTYRLVETSIPGPRRTGAIASEKNGRMLLETDLYRLELDLAHGGTFASLLAKGPGMHQFLTGDSERRFNEIRGYFPRDQVFHSTADAPAQASILEAGPVRLRVQLTGRLGSNTVVQTIVLAQGNPLIQCTVHIDWQGSPRIGADAESTSGSRREADRKVFYDNRFKLLALFPTKFRQQEIYKNAPFDVLHSALADTFFEAWSQIKNDIILDWVDVFDPDSQLGLMLLTDCTTSYAHGTNHPLGLTLQFCGPGLWGRDYSLDGPTEVAYALLPHAGDWRQAGLPAADDAWNEPLLTQVFHSEPSPAHLSNASLLTIDPGGWQTPTLRLVEGRVLVRLFNASSSDAPRAIHYAGPASKVELVELSGSPNRELATHKDKWGSITFELKLPPLAVGTLRITP